MLSRKFKIAISASAVLLVLAAVAFFWLRNQKTSERLVDVKRGPVIEAVYAIGTVESTQTFQAKVGVSSSIIQLPVQEGRAIRKGETLVVLGEGSAIRSRFDGIVTKVNYKVGESVFSGNVIVEVVDPSKFEIRILLDQRAALRVKRGQVARLSFDGLREKEFAGEVRTIYSTGAQFAVIVDTEKLPPEVLPGMTADISIEISRKPVASLIPLAAIRDGKVTRRRAGKRSQISVKTGLLNQDLVEIVEGDLVEGDQVAVNLAK
jgi:membrane fusion protein, macrolide-specific efflux system